MVCITPDKFQFILFFSISVYSLVSQEDHPLDLVLTTGVSFSGLSTIFCGDLLIIRSDSSQIITGDLGVLNILK